MLQALGLVVVRNKFDYATTDSFNKPTLNKCTPGRDLFLPQDHNLNKFGTGQRGDTNCEGFRHSSYRLEDILSYPYVSICKTCDPRLGHFVPMDII